jgi:hypothetical protein
MILLAAFASALFLLAVQAGPIGATQGRSTNDLQGKPLVESISRVDEREHQTIVIQEAISATISPTDLRWQNGSG